ncbi:MAG: hypothetical protein KJO34_02480, partial [Deltaproteobacteria bacterium]|nr:hypothetical protein [Deltaproteobacteria bacterium]
ELTEVNQLEEKLNTEAADNPNLPFWRLGFKYGATVNRAYIRWAEEALASLRKMETNRSEKMKC